VYCSKCTITFKNWSEFESHKPCTGKSTFGGAGVLKEGQENADGVGIRASN